MKGGAQFPPLVVFFDGEHYWLADGFHRYHAFLENKIKTTECVVHKGARRDAVLFAISANLTHGQRPTREDKEHAIRLLLADTEWRRWSNSEIARRCGVTHPTVAVYRQKLAAEERARKEGSKPSSAGGDISSPEKSSGENQTATYINRHGGISEMNTANLGGQSKDTESDDSTFLGPEEDVDELDEELEEVEEVDDGDERTRREKQLKKTCKRLWRWADVIAKATGKPFDAQSFVCQSTKLKRFCKMLGLAPSEQLQKLRPKPL